MQFLPHACCVCLGQVLKVKIGVPEGEQVSLIGPEFKGKNKWQNGFLGRDNAVYGLPCNAETVLRISEDDVSSNGTSIAIWIISSIANSVALILLNGFCVSKCRR